MDTFLVKLDAAIKLVGGTGLPEGMPIEDVVDLIKPNGIILQVKLDATNPAVKTLIGESNEN